MDALGKRFIEKKVEGWYVLWERVAQFIACAYSKRFHQKIKKDQKFGRYLESLSRKQTISSKDIKFVTPLGQIIFDHLKMKEEELANNKESPLEILRTKYKKQKSRKNSKWHKSNR